MHPLLVVALVCVVVIGFAVIALILKPTPTAHTQRGFTTALASKKHG